MGGDANAARQKDAKCKILIADRIRLYFDRSYFENVASCVQVDDFASLCAVLQAEFPYAPVAEIVEYLISRFDLRPGSELVVPLAACVQFFPVCERFSDLLAYFQALCEAPARCSYSSSDAFELIADPFPQLQQQDESSDGAFTRKQLHLMHRARLPAFDDLEYTPRFDAALDVARSVAPAQTCVSWSFERPCDLITR